MHHYLARLMTTRVRPSPIAGNPTLNGVSSEMLQLQNNGMSHPGYTGRSSTDNPPSVRIGMRVACAQLDPAASSSELRATFLRFLGQSEVMDLVRGLTEIQATPSGPRAMIIRHSTSAPS